MYMYVVWLQAIFQQIVSSCAVRPLRRRSDSAGGSSQDVSSDAWHNDVLAVALCHSNDFTST